LAKPIWIFGPQRGQPCPFAWLINGSPDCVGTEFSTIYDNTIEEFGHHIWWDDVDAEGERYTFGRPNFWGPFEWSTNPIYTNIATPVWYRSTNVSMCKMLKNKPDMKGTKEEFLYYAECADKLPGKYHAMVVRVTNLEDALKWVPDSKAVYTTCVHIPNITEMYVYFCGDFALTKAHRDDHAAQTRIKSRQPAIGWPLETGNSPNGYIPNSSIMSMATQLRWDIDSAIQLLEYGEQNNIVGFNFNDFMIANNTPNIYDKLGLARPTTEWINTWVERFRYQSKLDGLYNPDLQIVADKGIKSLDRSPRYQRFLKKG
tara:strand:- start:2986 stop:3930 length:945 start_codon:yes stop_codon:yes gene_type:complete